MTNLEEAIQHCEDVATENDHRAECYPKPQSHIKGSGRAYLKCKECAAEHRQLAEWLRKLQTYERGVELIKDQINNAKGNDMWEEANAMECALELLGVKVEQENTFGCADYN